MPDWKHVLEEIAAEQAKQTESVFDQVRRRYLKQLHDHTSRNVIAYYSGFLTKPRMEGVEIIEDDKNGFMLCIHELDKTAGLDLLLHTPGGSVAATESIVAYLREMFGNNIRAIVPQLAMSAGTMIACSCNSIVLGKHSNLGPVDPHFNGIPAVGVLEEIKRAYQEIANDPNYIHVWQPILSRLTPSFVQQCHWAVERSKTFVAEALKANMFSRMRKTAREEAAGKVRDNLTDLGENKGHDRHFHADECREMGLKVIALEEDQKLQDLVLTIHHCYMHTLANTPAFKIIENQDGKAMVRQQQMIIQQNLPIAASR
jgi:ATP-dependent protease ClpP protease subunit